MPNAEEGLIALFILERVARKSWHVKRATILKVRRIERCLLQLTRNRRARHNLFTTNGFRRVSSARQTYNVTKKLIDFQYFFG